MENKTKVNDKREFLWAVSFVCLCIVIFSFFQVVEINDAFMHPILIMLIAGLWREVAVLQGKMAKLGENMKDKS
ncbi:MAG: hypothetical protein JW869_07355 [Candidatus Omnitrophica bacterium]|nr:hypothetical protein [Candidatus Omnitrophota bacterium]